MTTISFFSFFFNFSKKTKKDFINFHSAFSISILFPHFHPRFPAFPLRFPAIPLYFPHSLHSHTHFTHSRLDFFHSHPHSPPSPHSVPRFLIPAFTDSPQNLDLLIINETKLDDSFPNSQFQINVYKCLRKDRNFLGGDLCFEINEGIQTGLH